MCAHTNIYGVDSRCCGDDIKQTGRHWKLVLSSARKLPSVVFQKLSGVKWSREKKQMEAQLASPKLQAEPAESLTNTTLDGEGNTEHKKHMHSW